MHIRYEHPGFRLHELRRLLRAIDKEFLNPDGTEPEVIYQPINKIRALFQNRVQDLERVLRQYPDYHEERKAAPLDTRQRR